MARVRFLLVAAIAAAACSAGAAAQAQVGPAASAALSTPVPVYQGTAFVTAITDVTASACEANGVGVGAYYTMEYRQSVEPGNNTYGGGIQFVNGRSAVSYVMGPGLPLNSGTQNQPSLTVYGASSEAGGYQYSGGFDLKISSPGTSKKPAAYVTITGTVTNIWSYTGCTITINAALALHP